MGSSRKYTPAPTPVMSSGGSSPYENMASVNSQQNNTSFDGNYGFFGNINGMQGGQQSNNSATPMVNSLSQGTNYSPFFMRF